MSSGDEEKKSRPFNPYDVQKIRLDKLFSNIDKPVEIPTRASDRKFAQPPDFVRNVMGSSAGAGSGEFHVYRHLRRKEYARLHFIETQARNEALDNEFHKKVEENRLKAEEATAKKRAKRLKKKEKLKTKKVKKDNDVGNDASNEVTGVNQHSEPKREEDSNSQPVAESSSDPEDV